MCLTSKFVAGSLDPVFWCSLLKHYSLWCANPLTVVLPHLRPRFAYERPSVITSKPGTAKPPLQHTSPYFCRAVLLYYCIILVIRVSYTRSFASLKKPSRVLSLAYLVCWYAQQQCAIQWRYNSQHFFDFHYHDHHQQQQQYSTDDTQQRHHHRAIRQQTAAATVCTTRSKILRVVDELVLVRAVSCRGADMSTPMSITVCPELGKDGFDARINTPTYLGSPQSQKVTFGNSC